MMPAAMVNQSAVTPQRQISPQRERRRAMALRAFGGLTEGTTGAPSFRVNIGAMMAPREAWIQGKEDETIVRRRMMGAWMMACGRSMTN
jgi:hypothetical protein